MSVSYIVEADGGSRGNPGPAGYGAVVKSADGAVLAEAAESIGVATNNVAEYQGLIAGLRALLSVGGDGASVEVRMDSKLVVEQMAGRWKVKNEGLRPYALEAAGLARRLRVTWTWIPRAQNSHADRLANEAMDAAARGEKWQSKTISAASSVTTSVTTSASSHGRTDYSSFASATTGDFGTSPTGSGRGTRDGGFGAAPTGDGDFGAASELGDGETAAPGGWRPPSRTATTLLLLRHGQTPLSVEKRFSGAGDPSLTETGREQAEAAAVRLSRKPYKIDAIVSSPLTRARQTADAVAAQTGLPVHVEHDLREADFGLWEGHTFAEVQKQWPDELAAWLADPAVPPPGGESFAMAAQRTKRARNRILSTHPGKTVLVVSHVSPIKLLICFALGAPPEALYRMHLDLACLSVIDYFPDGPALLRSFNDTAHLH